MATKKRKRKRNTLFVSRAKLGAIRRAQGHKCYYCGAPFGWGGDLQPTIDHKTPVWNGGTNDEANLAAACWRCNSEKGAMDAEVFKAVRLDVNAWRKARREAQAAAQLWAAQTGYRTLADALKRAAVAQLAEAGP